MKKITPILWLTVAFLAGLVGEKHWSVPKIHRLAHRSPIVPFDTNELAQRGDYIQNPDPEEFTKNMARNLSDFSAMLAYAQEVSAQDQTNGAPLDKKLHDRHHLSFLQKQVSYYQSMVNLGKTVDAARTNAP